MKYLVKQNEPAFRTKPVYLKFITTTFPAGLFVERDQARHYGSREEAEEAIKMIKAVEPVGLPCNESLEVEEYEVPRLCQVNISVPCDPYDIAEDDPQQQFRHGFNIEVMLERGDLDSLRAACPQPWEEKYGQTWKNPDWSKSTFRVNSGL